VRLLEALEPVLPEDSLRNFLQTLVLPKLKADVDAWSVN